MGILDDQAAAQPQAQPPPVTTDPVMQGQPVGAVEDDPGGYGGQLSLPGTSPATEQEQEQYEIALAAVAELVYTNDKSHLRLVEMLKSTGEQEGPQVAVVKATVVIITEVDKQIDIPEAVIINIVDEVFMMIAELLAQVVQYDMSEKELKQGVASAQQMILEIYGVERGDAYNHINEFDEAGVTELLGYMQEIQ